MRILILIEWCEMLRWKSSSMAVANVTLTPLTIATTPLWGAFKSRNRMTPAVASFIIDLSKIAAAAAVNNWNICDVVLSIPIYFSSHSFIYSATSTYPKRSYFTCCTVGENLIRRKHYAVNFAYTNHSKKEFVT